VKRDIPGFLANRIQHALMREVLSLIDSGIASPEDIDVAVVPGLAFDRRGHRVGYGGGFYDRFLGRLRPDALTVGICFSVQLVDEVPHGRGDRPVDLVVTEEGLNDESRP